MHPMPELVIKDTLIKDGSHVLPGLSELSVKSLDSSRQTLECPLDFALPIVLEFLGNEPEGRSILGEAECELFAHNFCSIFQTRFICVSRHLISTNLAPTRLLARSFLVKMGLIDCIMVRPDAVIRDLGSKPSEILDGAEQCDLDLFLDCDDLRQ